MGRKSEKSERKKAGFYIHNIYYHSSYCKASEF